MLHYCHLKFRKIVPWHTNNNSTIGIILCWVSQSSTLRWMLLCWVSWHPMNTLSIKTIHSLYDMLRLFSYIWIIRPLYTNKNVTISITFSWVLKLSALCNMPLCWVSWHLMDTPKSISLFWHSKPFCVGNLSQI